MIGQCAALGAMLRRRRGHSSYLPAFLPSPLTAFSTTTPLPSNSQHHPLGGGLDQTWYGRGQEKTKLSLTGIELRFEDRPASSSVSSLWDAEVFNFLISFRYVANRCLVFSLRFVANCCLFSFRYVANCCLVFSLRLVPNCCFVFSLRFVANCCSVFSFRCVVNCCLIFLLRFVANLYFHFAT